MITQFDTEKDFVLFRLKEDEYMLADFAIGFSGKLRHVTMEDKMQMDAGFFHWFRKPYSSTKTVEEYIEHWENGNEIHFI